MDIIATQVYENCDAASSQQISYSTQNNKIQVKINSIVLIFFFVFIYFFSIFNFFYIILFYLS